jgi:hypothetical protein
MAGKTNQEMSKLEAASCVGEKPPYLVANGFSGG